MLTNLGQIYGGLRRFEEASDCPEQALVICREVGYRQGEGRALHTVGIVYGKLHRFAEAVAYCEQALAIHRRAITRSCGSETS